jgi:hypothetical protein
MCGKYGSDWTKMLGENERQMFQSTFRYVPAGDGGYINNGIRRLVYGKNWSVNKVR